MTNAASEDLADVSAALIAAIAEAQARIEAGDSSNDLAEVVRHARELHRLLIDGIADSVADVGPRLRGLAVALGNNMEIIETALRGNDRAARI